MLKYETISKATLLFQNAIWIELLSKYFTENKSDSIVSTENIWCYCRVGNEKGVK